MVRRKSAKKMEAKHKKTGTSPKSMAQGKLEHMHQEILELKKDVALLKNILSEEELSDWAKKELEAARRVPDSELVDYGTVRRKLAR